ncbi:GMC oxidoreductase-domain-containing protein [Podospora conica]|nr:GMC oxidoreductase-domain-containing protein [Schizothecium conicum]
MGLYSALPPDLDEVDIIVVGGGSAGCIVAGRLAAADPNLSILLIEGGRNNRDVATVVNPLFLMKNLAPQTKAALYYKGSKSAHVGDREIIVPAGGILGGGSSINFMLYTRAQRSDFDSWNTPGWSADDLWPFLKKLETYHGPGEADHHGYDGPIHVSDGGYRAENITKSLLEAAEAVGYPEVEDLQNLENCNGFQRWLRTVSPEGRRQDTAHAFIHPLLEDGHHPNLHVLVEHRVIRVLFDEQKRASGVEFVTNPVHQPDAEPTKYTIKARKLVVLSSGSLGSPQILERSGVGNPAILEKAGVPVVANVPGVGHDYQDHHMHTFVFKIAADANETTDDYYQGDLTPEELVAQGHPMLRWNGWDVAAKVRPTAAQVAALGPSFQQLYDRDYKDNPNRPLLFIGFHNGHLVPLPGEPKVPYLQAATYSCYPYSRGHVHITGPTLTSPLDFATGYLTDPSAFDTTMLVWGYKLTRELIRRTPLYRGELATHHPAFPPGSHAALVDLDGPPATVTSNLEYSPADDAAIARHVRETMGTTWHSLGTNRMAPRAAGGVVDAALNVHGVARLKVVDLSVAPGNVGANTNNTAMVIGEKGASIIARELGVEFDDGVGRLVPGPRAAGG